MADKRTKATKRTRKAKAPAGDLDFRTELWNAADVLRSNVDTAEYKHVG